MAETATINVETNGYRNVIIRGTFVSADGSGITDQKVFDATSGGSFGVTAPGGQLVYPGLHTAVIGFDYDVQDVKLRVQWEASSAQDIFPMGNAPEDFDWRRFGGIRVPSGLTGATGSILISTVNCAPQSTFFFVMYLRKNVPQP